LGSTSGRTGFGFPILWHDTETSVSPRELSSSSETQVREDEDVLALLGSGDSTVLSCLVDRYSRLVLSIAHRILHDHGEAEDVVQDVFFQIYQKANLFDPTKGSAKAWIVSIALHKTLDRRSYLNRTGFYNGVDVESTCYSLKDGTDLERELGSRLDRVALKRAFAELTEMQRTTLELYFFEGLELAEITDRLDESKENIRHHFYRGLERLRTSAFVQQLKHK
jgi:RNA polymerase sigma-70 factor (ECF subfamily)